MIRALACFLCTASLLAANPDLFRERFADPGTRTASLALLLPGTRDAYFFTALDHQLAGREPEFRQVIAAWKAAAGREKQPVSEDGLLVLENRQLLLDYEKDPQAVLEELIRRFRLTFDHAKPGAADSGSLPSRLDPALILEEAFAAVAAEGNADTPYTRYRGARLFRELENAANFDEEKLRWFSRRLTRADLPGVVPLVSRALSLADPVAFGSVPLHEHLTRRQLAELLELHPDLRSSEAFAKAWLRKLRPGTAVDFERDPAAHAAHLQRCRDFVLPLPPALNSLKAHVLFHHLRLQRELANHPGDDFLAYLALPRSSHPLLRSRPSLPQGEEVELGSDYSTATGCPPVEDDQPLVEALLRHHLGQTDSAEKFAPFIEEKTLLTLHARARLLAGSEDARWSAALPADELRSLAERTEIAFAPGAPRFPAAADVIDLAVDLKNTAELLIRIYEIDLPSHFARHRQSPDVSLDLDGLVPHHERRLRFSQPPLRLHRESIALPELEGAGAWIVELVSGGISSRALIRKGALTSFIERTPTGQILRLFDENADVVSDAALVLGGEKISANPEGAIFIPNRSGQAPAHGHVVAGKLAAPVELGSRDEDAFALDARFFLDRGQLLAGAETELHLRVRLTRHGRELPLDRLQHPSLLLKATLLGGITTERLIASDLKLAPVLSVPFQVPADLLSLEIVLSGSVATADLPVTLSASETWRLNGDLETGRIATAFFAPTSEGHFLELRGRNGEPLPFRTVHFRFDRDDYETPVKATLHTDERGKIELGSLATIDRVTASGPDFSGAFYDKAGRHADYPVHLHLPYGEEIRLPLLSPVSAPQRARHSLVELDEVPLEDHFDKLTVSGPWLVIRDLPPGSHRLVQDGHTTDIRVASGQRRDELLVSSSLILPLHRPATPVIAAAAVEGDSLSLRLEGASPSTRISVIGKRYHHPEWEGGSGLLPFPHPLPDILHRGAEACAYLTERSIGDETRYILDRRAATPFPGSLLPRPGLLLHRWQEEKLGQDLQTGAGEGGGRGHDSPGIPSRSAGRNDRGSSRGHRATAHAVCDFPENPAVVRFDLAADADGLLRLPLDLFQSSQFIEIVAADAFASDTLRLPLPPSETPVRDRRLARPLDPSVPFIATRSAAVLAEGAEATIERVLDADWRAFRTLEDVRRFLLAASGDDRLAGFGFLTGWPDLSEERKLEFLAGYHSHELHLFLARKDRPFFEKHVKPHLLAKLQPRFVDDLLLERDLTPWLRAYAWQRLNAAEKALLARSLPEARDRIVRELELRWQREAPSPELQTELFTSTLRGADLSAVDSLLAANRDPFAGDDVATARLEEKLRRIIIPRIDFEDTTVEEALDFLRLRVSELDTLETDPRLRGIDFAMSGDFPRINELKLRDVPLGDVLRYIGDLTKMRYRISGNQVVLQPQTELGSDLFLRTFAVPPDFASSLDASHSLDDGDPFADVSPSVPRLAARPSIEDLLRRAGVVLGEGASASLTPDGKMVVRGAPSELEKIRHLIEFSGEDQELDSESVDPFSAPATLSARPSPPPSETRLWRESNYFHHPADELTGETLIPLNRFWIDLAAWDGAGRFLSPHFNACRTNANEALMCLALLDLPFKAESPDVSSEGDVLRIKARDPMILFYKDTRAADGPAAESPLLVRQSFHPLNEPTRREDGRVVENSIGADLRAGVPYGASLIVTNTSGIGRRIDVLAQIPAGAIPLSGKPATLSSTHELEPYGVLHCDLAFYFPLPGEFGIHPLGVSEEGVVLARTEPRVLRVSASPVEVDPNSWTHLAAEGTAEEVLDYLRSADLGSLDLKAILWRLADGGFYREVSALLASRLHFSQEVASYGFLHADVSAISSYLQMSGRARILGQWLDSPLLRVRPLDHHNAFLLEFDPLVNPRAHRFGDHPRFSHDAALKHYRSFLDQLAWKPRLDDMDALALTSFLFLQDRIEEALARLDGIDPEGLPSSLQYDYLRAVSLFHREQPADAAGIAASYADRLPPGSWRDRFQAVADQAAEIAALSKAGVAMDDEPDRETIAFDFTGGADGTLLIRHHGLEGATLRFYRIEREMVFSRNPFLQAGRGSDQEPPIKPNHIEEIEFAAGSSETRFELPEDLRGGLLVAGEAGAAKVVKVLDADPLRIRHLPGERLIQVFGEDGKPLVKAYVKVYAETRDGRIGFHKDGYTDLRGKFDYLSHTGVDVSRISRTAIFVQAASPGLSRTMILDR